ncbi:MAG: ice-binding family protein [Lutibacter sp.]
MIAKKLLTTIAFAFVLLFSGCAKDDFEEIDGVCPLVISTVPTSNAVGVPLDQVITATFNEVMNPSTITTASFLVSANGAQIAGEVAYAGTTATFTPNAPLLPNTEYTGTITTLAADPRGNFLQENYVWTFNTIKTFTVAVSSNPLIGGVTVGAGTFFEGTNVTVTATPNPGYTFNNWTEGGVIVPGATENYTFVLAGNRTLVANYSLQFVVAVSSNPLIGGVTTGGGSFDGGTSVTVTATPNPLYTFENWTEGGVIVPGATATYQFVIAGNRTLVANYTLIPPTQFAVLVSSNPVLGGVTTGTGLYDEGSLVTVTAEPNAGFTFLNWTEGGVIVPGATANYEFVIVADRTLVANYVPVQFIIALSVSPDLTGTTVGAGTFDIGSLRTVTATPEAGFVFENWTENNLEVSRNANYQFELTGNRTLVANFIVEPTAQFSLMLSSDPIDGGRTDGAGNFDAGQMVLVTATPNDGFTFDNWTDVATNMVVSSDTTYEFVLTKDTELVANFSEIPPTNAGLCPNPAVDLGMAGNFAVLAESAISTTGVTSVTGDMGISPLAASFITGFGLTLHSSGTYSTSTLVNGKIYAADYTSPTPSNLTVTVDNMHTAFTTANGLAPNYTEYLAGNLNDVTLDAGVYKYGTGLLLSNTITLDGGGVDCAAFVFQIAGDLTVANNVKIVLINGAKADNIFWVTAGAGAVIGSDVDFSGNILSKTLISLEARSSVKGRLLAQSAVSLIGNTVVMPSN